MWRGPGRVEAGDPPLCAPRKRQNDKTSTKPRRRHRWRWALFRIYNESARLLEWVDFVGVAGRWVAGEFWCLCALSAAAPAREGDGGGAYTRREVCTKTRRWWSCTRRADSTLNR